MGKERTGNVSKLSTRRKRNLEAQVVDGGVYQVILADPLLGAELVCASMWPAFSTT